MTRTTGENRRGFRTFRAGIILAGLLAFLPGIRAFGRSYSMTRWPVTVGRVTTAAVIAREEDRTDAAVDYEYILSGRVRRGRMLLTLASRSEADSVIARYPAGKEIAVGFDPGNPDLSVLRPRIQWWSLVLTLAGAGLMAVGFLPRRP